jgi:hypothetical protein
MIEIKQVRAYQLKINDIDYGVFALESAWEGLQKIVSGDGTQSLIIKHSGINIGIFCDGEIEIVSSSGIPDIADKGDK